MTGAVTGFSVNGRLVTRAVWRSHQVGLARLEEHGRGQIDVGDYVLKVGTGWPTRVVCPDGPARLAKWRASTSSESHVEETPAAPTVAVTDGVTADPIEHPDGSPKGDRPQRRSCADVAAADDTAPSTIRLPSPSPFTSRPTTEPAQLQLF